MDRAQLRSLESTVEVLQDVARRIDRLTAGSDEVSGRNLQEIKAQSEAGARYYESLIPKSPRRDTPGLAHKVGMAAFSSGLIGLATPKLNRT